MKIINSLHHWLGQLSLSLSVNKKKKILSFISLSRERQRKREWERNQLKIRWFLKRKIKKEKKNPILLKIWWILKNLKKNFCFILFHNGDTTLMRVSLCKKNKTELKFTWIKLIKSFTDIDFFWFPNPFNQGSAMTQTICLVCLCVYICVLDRCVIA